MKRLFLAAILLTACGAYASEAEPVNQGIQFRNHLFAQSPAIASVYETLTSEQQAQFDATCGKLAGLTQQALDLLRPEYLKLFGEVQELGIAPFYVTLTFGGQQTEQLPSEA